MDENGEAIDPFMYVLDLLTMHHSTLEQQRPIWLYIAKKEWIMLSKYTVEEWGEGCPRQRMIRWQVISSRTRRRRKQTKCFDWYLYYETRKKIENFFNLEKLYICDTLSIPDYIRFKAYHYYCAIRDYRQKVSPPSSFLRMEIGS